MAMTCVARSTTCAALSAALMLARAGRSVQVFDRQRPGEGASTRNGGIASGNLRPSYRRMVAKFGRARADALQAEAKAAREDLARFILRTNAAVLQSDMTPVFWTGGLQGSGPPRLADRLETQRAALAVPRQMEILEEWQARARGVGYFDEDYQASQVWKADWEAADGDRVAERARATVEMLEPLRAPAAGQAPAGEGAAAGENPEGSPG